MAKPDEFEPILRATADLINAAGQSDRHLVAALLLALGILSFTTILALLRTKPRPNPLFIIGILFLLGAPTFYAVKQYSAKAGELEVYPATRLPSVNPPPYVATIMCNSATDVVLFGGCLVNTGGRFSLHNSLAGKGADGVPFWTCDWNPEDLNGKPVTLSAYALCVKSR